MWISSVCRCWKFCIIGSRLRKSERAQGCWGAWLWCVSGCSSFLPNQERQFGERVESWCARSRSPASPRTSGTTRMAASTGRHISPNSQVGWGADRAALAPTWAEPSGSNAGCAAPPRPSHPPPKPVKPLTAHSASGVTGTLNQYLVIFRLKPSHETITWV